MDKNAIFNEFKKKKEEEKKAEIVQLPKNTKYQNKKKKNKNGKIEKNKLKVKALYINDSFEKWKENFLSNETNKDFIELIGFYKKNNFEIFTDEEFLKIKYEHPLTKVIILDPSFSELNVGKGGTTYLIKPLYTDEYNYFIKNIGTRDEKPEEFLKYCLEKSVLYPEFNNERYDKLGAGTILALYKYILEISDFTKTIRVLEV